MFVSLIDNDEQSAFGLCRFESKVRKKVVNKNDNNRQRRCFEEQRASQTLNMFGHSPTVFCSGELLLIYFNVTILHTDTEGDNVTACMLD